MKRILIPAIATLVCVVSFVAISGWNRSDAPRLLITLTERELGLPSYTRPDRDDDPGLQLRFDVADRDEPLDARNWLTEERLRSLGFAFDVMPGAPEAEDVYRRALPRIAWVAFEYDGEAWRDRERRLALQDPQHDYGWRSRLVPVDASLDFAALLARYPSGHLILRAGIALQYVPPAQKGPLVFGRIRQVIPPTVYVPRALRDRVAGLSQGHQEPRYEVDLAVGRLGLPYITAIRRLLVQ